jgi:DNA-directed RNA polymerase subunit RPC12/RpoP
MPECEKCGEEINSLDYKRTIHGTAKPENGMVIYSPDFDKFRQEITYSCPKCGQELFNDDYQAEQFLKGGGKCIPLKSTRI